eukprot:TRINITY_DN12924_c0_g1_i1.p1 TRINITY_DN12924_c0_g1~~TRINITY_DN12924_c0_g1_i1.p1  ORF type:complete len:364 (+),score=61.97 TRINITY_DN12924_c0_g1_i1:11-1102(+)
MLKDPRASSWKVQEWLRSFNMHQYTSCFEKHGYTNPLVCSHLTKADLVEMGITKMGHTLAILNYSERLRDQNKHLTLTPPTEPNYLSAPLRKHNLQTSPRGGMALRAKMVIDQSNFMNYFGQDVELVLVRHGRSEGNDNPQTFASKSDHAIPLSSSGKEESRIAGQQIAEYYKRKFPKGPASDWKCSIWTSTYKRARETAEIIKEEAKEWVTDVKESIFLVEQQYGLFEGIDWTRDEKAFPKELEYYNRCYERGGLFWAKVPMGESRFDVCQRAFQCLGLIHDDAKSNHINSVIIVSHGVTLKALMMCYFNLTPEWFEEEKNPHNGSVRRMYANQTPEFIWEGKGSYYDAPDGMLVNKGSKDK